ncbi:universal stress protein [Rhizobium calliandrae]|uniref:Universal stress protein n=1 Tax=Rhizobium calliandrae TaxID=1312182 RepID=A0ABT7KNR8_9HYPH|nr:universal stress protein [Rhizobium calliandrae]MDL2410280.1 universal stress protein [Rhizobium calliandrae]
MKPQFHLPLVTYPESSSFAIVQNAVDFARHQKADLTASVLQVRIPAVRQSFPLAIEAEKMISEAERFSRDSGEAVSETVRDYAQKAGIHAFVRPFEAQEPFLASTLAELSRAYDCSLVEASEAARPIIESILFESGRPLVLFPPDNFCGRIDTAAIAWDGSAALSRALTGARPFLENASRVVLISVTDDKAIDETARDRFATVLGNAGLNVEAVSIKAHGEQAANVIQFVAKENYADLLVAGAFGHSRLREFILGGVTRSLLANLEMPALLSH